MENREIYALLLTDIHMPGMDGHALASAIRAAETSGGIPITALPAIALKGEAGHCRSAGMDDYRSKPVPLSELKAMLEKRLPPAALLPEVCSGSETPVDVSVLEALIGSDRSVLREFLRDFFCVSAAKIAAELKTALENAKIDEACAAAHKLKSSARSVGAFKLEEFCERIEQAGILGDNPALIQLLPLFEAEMTAVKVQLATGSHEPTGRPESSKGCMYG